MDDVDYGRPWYHGSVLSLTVLREGSSITQNPKLAEAFSHKPTLVSISDEGGIKHNGTAPGFIYRIAEDIEPGDIRPHPASTMDEADEWLSNRELRLDLIGPVELSDAERLTGEEIAELRERMRTRES